MLINRNSLRAASYCAFKTMTDLNSLKPCILSFVFEAVAKTAVNANARLYEVGVRGGTGISAELVVAFAVTVAFVKQTG